MGTQFSLHKTSLDLHWRVRWSKEKTADEVDKFYNKMKKMVGPSFELQEKFFHREVEKHLASRDCKENESNNKGYLVGDEIGVGALWEDKSQKDFKSYL